MNDLILALNEFEPLVLIGSAIITAVFIFKWYSRLLFSWPLSRGKWTKLTLALLPPIAFAIIFYTLKTAASFDVVSDPYYLAMYTLFGFAWLYSGVIIMSMFFNLSWVDDTLHLNNTAALFAFTGGFLGLAIMYAYSNIGDGPGWACVLFTCALGWVTWTVLVLLVNRFTEIFERITVERDLACGIRTGCFLLAMSLVMSQKLAGDWDSVHMTLVDFVNAGPALAAIVAELIFTGRKKEGEKILTANAMGRAENIAGSVIWGITLVAASGAGALKIYG